MKVLSLFVNTSCAERAWSTYAYIHSVKRKKMNVDRAESLVYVNYNHRMLSRYREDYEGLYQKWDVFADDDNFENDTEAIENRESCLLHDDHVSHITARPSFATSSLPPRDLSQGIVHFNSRTKASGGCTWQKATCGVIGFLERCVFFYLFAIFEQLEYKMCLGMFLFF